VSLATNQQNMVFLIHPYFILKFAFDFTDRLKFKRCPPMILHPAKPSPKFDCLSMSLTLNQPGSGKTINYQGPFSFGLPFTRCKLTSPSIWQMCNRALRFRESSQNGGAILLCLERARPDWEPASPRTLRSPGREI
jgi:hypothetical protein